MGSSDRDQQADRRLGTGDPGDATLDSYELAAGAYAARNQGPYPGNLPLLDRVIDVLRGGCVLELGSGPGIDADYLERGGVRVIRTDATVAFVEMMRAKGVEARRLDVRTDSFDGPYDGIVAIAVLLHLTPAQLSDVLGRLRAAVRDGGVLAFSLKEGDGSEWTTAKIGRPRYFTYWREEQLRTLLDDTGWVVEWIEHAAGPADDWLYVIAR